MSKMNKVLRTIILACVLLFAPSCNIYICPKVMFIF